MKVGEYPFSDYRSSGLIDSYSTWLWPRRKGFELDFWNGKQHPDGPEHGRTKYANLVWHAGGDPVITGIPADQGTPAGWGKIKDRPIKFSDMTALRDGISEPISDRMVAYCWQGQVDESQHLATSGPASGLPRIVNFGSHAKGGKGGTNVIFADLHVEYLPGSQITAGN